MSSLILKLTSEGAKVRKKAAVALGEAGDPRAVEPLLRLMRAESHRIVQDTLSRYRSGISIGGGPPTREREGGDYVIRMNVRGAAADALVRIGSPAVPGLIDVVNERSDVLLLARLEAARALGEIGGQAAKSALEALQTSKDVELKDAAERALQHIQGSSSP